VKRKLRKGTGRLEEEQVISGEQESDARDGVQRPQPAAGENEPGGRGTGRGWRQEGKEKNSVGGELGNRQTGPPQGHIEEDSCKTKGSEKNRMTTPRLKRAGPHNKETRVSRVNTTDGKTGFKNWKDLSANIL